MGVPPGSTSIDTPSFPRAPLTTTSITSRTESSAPTTGSAGRTVISRMTGSAAAAADDAGTGTVSAPAVSEASTRLLVMIETVGTTR
jgi:hypothetical protein